MAPDVLDRLRAADPAARMPKPDPDDRERLRRAIVASPADRRARSRWRWRLGGRTLFVLLGGAILLVSGTVYAARLVIGLQGEPPLVALRSGTWQRLPLAVDGGPVQALIVDPTNSATLYAGTPEGLFKSTDGAASWKRLPVRRDVRVIAVDPQSPSHLFVWTPPTLGHTGLLESRNGGATWSVISRFPHVSIVGHLWIDDSSSPSTLYAACYGYVGGFFRSGNGGRTWAQLDAGVKAQAPSQLAIDPSAHVLYATSTNTRKGPALVCSSDGGATWRDLTSHLPAVVRSAETVRLRVDPADTSRLYLYAGKDVDYPTTLGFYSNPYPVFDMRAVLASTDGGRTWSKLAGKARDWPEAVLNAAPGTPESAVRRASAALSRFDRAAIADGSLTGASSGARVEGVQAFVIIDPRDPSVLYVPSAQGVYKSTDGGVTWRTASEGIENHAVFAVLPDTTSRSTLLALTAVGLVRSTDGGSTCATLLRAALTTVLAAPSSPSTLYATTSRGVVKSTDGGRTWSRAHNSGLPTEPGELDLVMVASDRPGTVYVNVMGDPGGGLYRSTDGGRTWRKVEGLPRSAPVRLLQEVPGDPSTVFAGFYGSDGNGPSHAGRLFRSTDRGRTWTMIGDASWGAGPLALAIDPHAPSRMLITTEETPVWHRSTDGGRTWHHFVVHGPAMYPEYLVFDPRRRHTVYAVTAWDESHSYVYPAVYRSTDGGATWEDISWDLPDYWPALVVDAAPGGALYAATEAGLYKWVPRGQ